MNKILPLLLLLPPLVNAAECERLPNGLFRLSNSFIQADIDVLSGARCISIIDKQTNMEYTSSAWDMGIGGECDWQERKMTASIWYGKPYAVQGTKNGDVAEIRCQRTGTGDIGQWITITKIYRLPSNSTELEVSYDIAVQSEAMKSISFFLWLHNSIQLAKENVTMLFPKGDGVNSIGFKPGAPVNESFHYDMTDSWIAVARSAHPSGVILQTPYRDLMCFYNWQGGEGNTIEQMFRAQNIQAGTSFQTYLKLTFYHGLQTIDGSGAGVAAQFTNDGIKLYSAIDDDAVVTATFRKPPELLEQPVVQLNTQLQCAKTQDIAIPFSAHQGDELIVRVKTSHGTMTMRRPFDIKDYKYSPVEKRRGSDEDRYGMTLLNEDSCRDCYEWVPELPVVNGDTLLKPDANGRLKLLVVTDMMSGREAYEIAGRMDAELTTCTFSTGGDLGWHPTWGHSGGIPEVNLYLGQLLKKDYDAIIFGGQQFDAVTPKNMETIKAKVDAGTALITIAPRMIPKEFAQLFPVKPTVDKAWGVGSVHFPMAESYKIADDSPIRNFPFKSLGFVPLFPCQPQSAAITCGNGQPFFAHAAFGKGRIASFTWLNGIDDNTTRAGIMPFFADEPELPWHNVFYGMIIKATQFAVGRVPKLAIKEFNATHDSLRLSIDNTLERDIEAECLLSIYQSNDKPERRTFPIKLKKGINNFTLPMDIRCHAMLSLAELRLTADGLAFDFAYDTIGNPFGLTINAESLPDRIIADGESFAFKALFTGHYDRAEAIIRDLHGRVLARSNFHEGSVTLTPRGVVEHRAELTVNLYLNDQKACSRVFVIDLAPQAELSRDWDNYKVMLSWPVRDKRVLPFHLRPVWQETLDELGIDLVMTHGIPVGPWADNRAKFMLNYRYVGPLVMESITRLSRSSGLKGLDYPQFDYRNRKKEVQQITEEFGKTGDVSILKRNPRLDDDGFITSYQNALDQWMPKLIRWRPFMCDLGDEMSYGVFTSPLDFDFSPEGLALFRKWLRQRYKDDLGKLNAEWQRDFKSWDDVMPDTGSEAQTRGVFSGWALHRLYSTVLFANFWNVVATRSRQLDPGLRISASGTPNSHPYNGYDYEKLMPAVDSLIAYTNNGLAELIATFKKAPLMSWVGYGSPEAEVWKTIWDNAFNGHFGVGFYCEMTMLNPSLTLTRNGVWARDAVRALHDGVGLLLYHCDSSPDALVHYSMPSLMASGALQTYNSFIESYGIWIKLLKEHNCNPRFITPSAIERGDLLSSGVKLLVLPNSTALSDAEIDAFRKFSENGGKIIADIQPGRFNENVATASADRLQGIPLHMIGENLVQDMTAPLMQKVSKELDEMLPRHHQTITAIDGQPEIHTYSLCAEGGELFGIWPARPSVISLTPPAGHTVYDVLGKKAVTGEIRLPANRPGVFAALPYSVTGVNVTREKTQQEVSVSAHIMTSGGAPLRHVLLFRVKDADGKELKYHRRTLNAPNGTAKAIIPLAANEDASRWTIEVTDVISGMTGK